MKTKTVIKLNSDNFENALISMDAYREVRLEMSTGDFHSHKYEILEVEGDTPVIVGFCHLTGNAIFDDEQIAIDEDEEDGGVA